MGNPGLRAGVRYFLPVGRNCFRWRGQSIPGHAEAAQEGAAPLARRHGDGCGRRSGPHSFPGRHGLRTEASGGDRRGCWGVPGQVLLDPVVDPVHLSQEINGRRGTLYWAHFAVDRPGPKRVRAMLVLDGQRCVRGVLRVGDVADGPEGRQVPVSKDLPEGDDLRAIRTLPWGGPTVPRSGAVVPPGGRARVVRYCLRRGPRGGFVAVCCRVLGTGGIEGLGEEPAEEVSAGSSPKSRGVRHRVTPSRSLEIAPQRVRLPGFSCPVARAAAPLCAAGRAAARTARPFRPRLPCPHVRNRRIRRGEAGGRRCPRGAEAAGVPRVRLGRRRRAGRRGAAGVRRRASSPSWREAGGPAAADRGDGHGAHALGDARRPTDGTRIRISTTPGASAVVHNGIIENFAWLRAELTTAETNWTPRPILRSWPT